MDAEYTDTVSTLTVEQPDCSRAVYAGIAQVQAAMARLGIGKDRRNQQQGYNFRGIDDVFNALAGIMAEHRLVFVPHYSDRQVFERETKSGGVLYYVTLVGRFRVTSTIDGSWIEVTTIGEAMDSGDKATNKAMSTALKYAVFQLFFVPIQGDEGMIDPERDNPAPLPSMMTRAQLDTAYDIAHAAFGLSGTDLQKKIKDCADILRLPPARECTYKQGEELIAELRKFAASQQPPAEPPATKPKASASKPMSDAQRRKIHAAAKEAFPERADALDEVIHTTATDMGLPESLKEFTSADASALIERLELMIKKNDEMPF
jgi:hypothetical protein